MKVVFHVELHWHRWADPAVSCLKTCKLYLKLQRGILSDRCMVRLISTYRQISCLLIKMVRHPAWKSLLKIFTGAVWSPLKLQTQKNKIPPSHDLWIEAWRLQSWNWCWLTGGIPQTPCWTPCSLQRGLPCRKRNTEVCGLCWRSSACAQQAGLDFSMNR